MSPTIALGAVISVILTAIGIALLARRLARADKLTGALQRRVHEIQEFIGHDPFIGFEDVQSTSTLPLRARLAAVEEGIEAWKSLPELPTAIADELAELRRWISDLETRVPTKSKSAKNRLDVVESEVAALSHKSDMLKEDIMENEQAIAEIQSTIDDVWNPLPQTHDTLGRLATLRGDVDRLQAAEEETVKRLNRHDEAAGNGFWKTSDGSVLRIRDMTDHHLLNLIDGDFGGMIVRELMQAELDRRTVDRAFEKATTPTLGLDPSLRAEEARNLARQASATDGALGSIDGPTDVPMAAREVIRDQLKTKPGDQDEPQWKGF